MLNDVQKKYAHTKDVKDEFPLDAGVTAQAHRNELLIRTLDLKHMFPTTINIYVQCMTYAK